MRERKEDILARNYLPEVRAGQSKVRASSERASARITMAGQRRGLRTPSRARRVGTNDAS